MDKVCGVPVFKISASIIKPARESLLDYCSYCLFIIAITGLSRVWIGGASFSTKCEFKYSGLENHGKEVPLDSLQLSSQISPTVDKVIGDYGMLNGKLHVLDLTGTGPESPPFTALTSRDNFISHDFRQVNKTEYPLRTLFTGNKTSLFNKSQPEHCSFQDQSVFAYVVLLESSILLLIGLIWPKVPEVSGTLNKFSKLVHACEENVWAKKALKVITDRKQPSGFVQSTYSLVSDDHAGHDFESLLDILFHPDNEYQTKANARHLYERVQVLCEVNSNTCTIWKTYVVKSLLQFLLWITVFNINLVLFVVLEFYVMCHEDGSLPCNHDTFLRIVWFFTETVLMIYAFFNCKTLLWISDKSSAHERSCPNVLNFLTTCRRPYNEHRRHHLIYRFAHNPPVYNDVALLLHLLEEARPETALYFVVFMFPEWNKKIISFADPTSETPLMPTIRTIFGRPPPRIEIQDLSDENGRLHKFHSNSIFKENLGDNVTSLFIDNEMRHKSSKDGRTVGTSGEVHFGSTDAANGCENENICAE